MQRRDRFERPRRRQSDGTLQSPPASTQARTSRSQLLAQRPLFDTLNVPPVQNPLAFLFDVLGTLLSTSLQLALFAPGRHIDWRGSGSTNVSHTWTLWGRIHKPSKQRSEQEEANETLPVHFPPLDAPDLCITPQPCVATHAYYLDLERREIETRSFEPRCARNSTTRSSLP